MPISVGRRKTLNLLDDVVGENKLIAVVSQRNPSEDDPDPAGMYRVGSAARILKVVKLNGNNVNLIIQGIRRIRVDRFTATDPFMKASVTALEEHLDAGVGVVDSSTSRGAAGVAGFGMSMFMGKALAFRIDARNHTFRQELLDEHFLVNDAQVTAGLSLYLPMKN